MRNNYGNGTGYGVPTIEEALQDQDDYQGGAQLGVNLYQKDAANGKGGSPNNGTGDGDSAEEGFNLDSELEDAFESFYQGYVACLLWTEGVDAGNSLDLTESLRRESHTDCRNFFRDYAPLFGTNYEQAGHDFWLSRNGHGTGFFDRDYDGFENQLQEAARRYGSVYVYYDENSGRVDS